MRKEEKKRRKRRKVEIGKRKKEEN